MILVDANLLLYAKFTSEAWAELRAWLACPPAWTPAPGEGHAAVLDGLVRAGGLTPKLVSDAHRLAIEHGLILCSADRDFAGFPTSGGRTPSTDDRGPARAAASPGSGVPIA